MTAKLNEYVWELYKASFEGQLALSYFERLDKFAERADLFELFMGVGDWIYAHTSDDSEWTEITLGAEDTRYVTAVRDAAQKLAADTPENIQQLLTHMVSSGTVALSDEDGDVLSLDDVFGNLHLLSLGLHLAHPDVFLPYGLVGRFYFIPKIAQTFGLPLPPVPPKNDRLARWLYYGQLCAAFQEFRKLDEMTLAELMAFMYDFSVNYVGSGENDDLPEPRNAWLLIGGVENGDLEWMDENQSVQQTHWQGNLDMRRGDVCIMYVRSPVSAVHSLWRVVEDAYEDPFFHYKHTVQIGQPLRLPALHFRELASDSLLGQNKYVKANLQGASGKALSHDEYERTLQMLSIKANLPLGIPHFAPQKAVDLSKLASERDVEIQLIEPLLQRAGLEEKDWVRQLSVRMGRGERVYPDYAIGLSGVAPEQRARALVEVKYRAAGERDWREAFLQVKSYGLRLGARIIVTAAAEGVRVYQKKNDDFDFASGQHLNWGDLQEGEALRELGWLLAAK